MGTKEITDKLWQLCDVLRDDGIVFHQYLNELTYILFLKLMEETENEDRILEGFRWNDLKNKEESELIGFYQKLRFVLGGTTKLFKNQEGNIQENLTDSKIKADKKDGIIWEAVKIDSTVLKIYDKARSDIDEPKNLQKIIRQIDELDWYSAKEEGLGDMYEGLLEKNAGEKKSGAGQYFTRRALVNVMVRCLEPKINECWNDPAFGTFGFMIAVDHYLRAKYDNYNAKGVDKDFQKNESLSGVELVRDAYRLGLMNAILHDISADKLYLGDTLSEFGEQFMETYDGVLANPPFGTKKGGERPTHKALEFKTSNKQLNFVQHIYKSLHKKGGARAAIVLPDNVLFAGGDGQKVREDLMEKCNLHTILRLPSKTFDYAGVQTNVLFFERGKKDKGNTKEVWFYDMRTDMPSFGKRTPLTETHFADFEKAYHADDRRTIKDPRWSVISRKEIATKEENLDIGLMENGNGEDYKDLPPPAEIAKQTKAKLLEAVSGLEDMIKILEE